MTRALSIALLLCAWLSHAATYTAATAERADVQSKLNLAVAGDTVNVPAGASAAYTAALTNFLGIYFTGAGSNATIINGGSLTYAAIVDTPQGATNRISGINWTNCGTALHLMGSNGTARVRVHSCLFTNCSSWAIEIDGALGIIDHNTIYGNHQVPLAYVKHGNWNTLAYSAGSQADANNFGGEQFIFFEDNVVSNSWPSHVTLIDGYGGTRYVLRYNTFFKGSTEWHGRESGRQRGGRACEIYKNQFIGNDSGAVVAYMRSGVGLIWSNTITGYLNVPGVLSLVYDSADAAFPPYTTGGQERAGADGQNPWDVNLAGGPFATGTASGASVALAGNVIIVTNSTNPGWTADQWAGYSINRTSGKSVSAITSSGGTATVTCTSHGFTNGHKISIRGANESPYNTTATITSNTVNSFTFPLDYPYTATTPASGTMYAFRGYSFSQIVSNTANTITYKISSQTIDTGANFYDCMFANADTYAFYKVTQGMDQPGRVMGSIISGADPAVRPGGWNDQTTSLWYQWSNTYESGSLAFSANYAVIRAGEHYTNSQFVYTPFTYPHYMVSGVSPIVHRIATARIGH